MNLSAIRDPESWERRLSTAHKRLIGLVRGRCDSVPVFVLGKQRSGTSMLMRAFHRHPDMLVFDEHRSSPAFLNHRLRDTDTVRDLLERARFPAVALKPICDSHRIREIYEAFPAGKYIWIYRDYADVANSSLREFGEATRAIRLACLGEPGGGWFQEGISARVNEVLRRVYRPELSDFDLACLAWWVRNQIIIESALAGHPNVTIIKYEPLVENPALVLKWLFERIGMHYTNRVGGHMTPRSIGRHRAPEMDVEVQKLCSETLAELNRAFEANGPLLPAEVADRRHVDISTAM